MKRFILFIALAFLLTGCKGELVLYAAQLPTTVHVVWDPPTDATSQYLVVSDTDAPITVLTTSCTTTCSQVLTINSFGQHTVSITPQALAISTDPNSLTSGSPAVIQWVLNNSANPVKTVKVIK